MAITIDTLNEMFSDAQNDMQQIVTQCKEEFYRPETDRETVRMWLTMPQIMREVITKKNPGLAKELNGRAEKLRKGDINYGNER